jgi:hypothetical protein
MVHSTELIQHERERQIHTEGFTAEHDDAHVPGELLDAALCYVLLAQEQTQQGEGGRWKLLLAVAEMWPWDHGWWKPSPDPVRNLVKAGALIAAEIDRLQRRNGA